MKKIITCVLAALQIAVFYLLPLTAGPTDIMGLVILQFTITFILSILMGFVLDKKYKTAYPFLIMLIFFPIVFIYYNVSALIYCIWYLVGAAIGVIIGTVIKKLLK